MSRATSCGRPCWAATAALASAVFVVAAGCGADEDGGGGTTPAAGATQLTVTLRPTGDGGETHTWMLRCEPAGGTHPAPGAACFALAELERPFTETPPDMACTELYGGPATAHVTGTLAGEPVDTRFGRANGCEIERWTRHEMLIDPDGQAGGQTGS